MIADLLVLFTNKGIFITSHGERTFKIMRRLETEDDLVQRFRNSLQLDQDGYFFRSAGINDDYDIEIF